MSAGSRDGRRGPGRADGQPEEPPEEATKISAPLAQGLAAAGPARRRACFIVLAGGVAGEVHPIEQDETVMGRGQDAGIRIDESGISRNHARVLRESDGRFILEDLGSTNGTFVGDIQIRRRELVEGDRVRLGTTTVLKFSLQDDVEHTFQKEMYESAVRDPLTRAFNRKYLMDRLRTELSFARRHKTSVSLLVMDIDHFKNVNDTLGHLAGDAALKALAGALQQQIRAEDVVARYGGDEFIVLVRNVGGAGTMILAERVRRAMESMPVSFEGRPIKVTLSIGIAFTPDGSGFDSPEDLIAHGDQKLYEAKRGGRNMIVM